MHLACFATPCSFASLLEVLRIAWESHFGAIHHSSQDCDLETIADVPRRSAELDCLMLQQFTGLSSAGSAAQPSALIHRGTIWVSTGILQAKRSACPQALSRTLLRRTDALSQRQGTICANAALPQQTVQAQQQKQRVRSAHGQATSSQRQGKPDHKTAYNDEKLLGSSSAGRAMLNKKVNGFAQMVQWVESEPKAHTPAPSHADGWSQAAVPRRRVKAIQPRQPPVANQGRPERMMPRTVQHPPAVQSRQAAYGNQISDIDSKSPDYISVNLSSTDSHNISASQDLHLHRLQAAASAWRSASISAKTHQTQPDAAGFSSNTSLNGSHSGMNQVSSVSTPARQANDYVRSPVSHQQWQPDPMPSSQYEIAQSPLPHPQAQQARLTPDMAHVGSLAAAAADIWSYMLQQRNSLSSEYGQVSENAVDYSFPPTATHRAPSTQMRHQSDGNTAVTAEASELQASMLAEQWGGSWQHPDRGLTMYMANGEGGSASVNLTEVSVPPPPPPPPPPRPVSVNSSTAKASWWAALKGEVHPFDLG